MAHGRTRLTGGGELEPSTGASELYTPGLALPREPHVTGPWRRRLIVFLVVVVVITGVLATYRLVTVGQDFDPALTDQPASPPPDPGG
ncbi:MAG: hypothetical protein KY469_00245 [Actinobacteria bacterium]|nr:hypothetical protein [Actinomycetota bacterium]